MATYTTAATGNWSNASTWSGGTPPTGGPGDGDLVVISGGFVVTVDSAAGASQNGIVTIGTDSGTAIQFSGGTDNIGLTMAAGTTLIVKGNINDNQYNKTATVTIGAGCTLKMYPSSGATLTISSSNSTRFRWYINGTSGSRCTVTTDKSRGGNNSNMNGIGNQGPNGIQTATYTDFSNFGSTSAYGIMSRCEGSGGFANGAITVTNCTFTNCNYRIYDASTAWDGNFAFTNNSFTSSASTTNPGVEARFVASINAAKTSGTRLVQYCAFDKGIASNARNHISYQDNVMAHSVAAASPFTDVGSVTQWSVNTDFTRNVMYWQAGSSSGNPQWSIAGPIKDIYSCNGLNSNPHHSGPVNSASMTGTITLEGVIYESPGCTSGAADPGGDAFIPSSLSSATTFKIRNWVAIPNHSDQNTAGTIFSLVGAPTNVTLDVEHCTFTAGVQAAGDYSETVNSAAGQISSFKANLIWNTSARKTASSFKMMDVIHPTASGVSDVLVAGAGDYNAGWNLQTTPAAGNTYTHAKNGYQGNFSTDPGTHDVADANPLFVDSTRNIGTWYTVAQGQTTTGTYLGDVAAAIARLSANPTLIGQAGTGLLYWVRAGFNVKNASLKAASYPSDPSTADANGNAWPGGSPGIGAMNWQSGTTGAPALLSSL